jgi:4-hydroxybenzoyl-CoA reductase subunit beta
LKIKDYHNPKSLDDLFKTIQEPGCAILGGGTDIMPHLKNGLNPYQTLVSMMHIPDLNKINVQHDKIIIGASVTLQDLIDHEKLYQHFPVIRNGLSKIGSPQHRQSGTIAGNLCLDTRCNYYNQSEFWRDALGYCRKFKGEICHVVPNSDRCHAVMSSDGVAVFVALKAEIIIQSKNEKKQIKLENLYKKNGMNHLNLNADELITHIILPFPKQKLFSDYQKLRARKSFDFPLLGMAGSIAVKNNKIIELCKKKCTPLNNTFLSAGWRRKMITVFLERFFSKAGINISIYVDNK